MTYPKARIPTDPVLCTASFSGPDRQHVPSVTDVDHVVHVTSGRMAIGLALQQMQVAAFDEILLPAYHSRSMVEPVIWFGAMPVFYRIKADTAVDLNDVAARITPRTKVLVVVNYFGFPQDLVALRAFCDAHHLLMLEDCAHASIGAHAGKPLGSFGDYAIASTMKFLPVYDGGCLVSSRNRLDHVKLVSAGLKFEVKTAFNTLEKAFAYGRMKPLAALLSIPMHLKNALWGLLKSRSAVDAGPVGPRASDGGFGFEAQWLDKKASVTSRLLLATVSMPRVAEARRRNYLRLQAALADLPGCAPLYPVLPEAVFPWVFPMLVDDPDTCFPILKHAGVPVIRFAEFLWDGLDESVCPVSVDLSRRVMQFPCHQELRETEIDWMIERIRTILLATPVSMAMRSTKPLQASA